MAGRRGRRCGRPEPGRLQGDNRNVARMAATVFTLGSYGLWWLHDQMVEPSVHVEENWRWEDDLARAVFFGTEGG
mgnify:CR=1 FL=1